MIKKIIIILMIGSLQSCSINKRIVKGLNCNLREVNNITYNNKYKPIIYEKLFKLVLEKHFKTFNNREGNYIIINEFDNSQQNMNVNILKNKNIQSYLIQKNQDNKITVLKNKSIYSLLQIKIDFIINHIEQNRTSQLLKYHLEKDRKSNSESTISIYVFRIKGKEIIIDEVLSFKDFWIDGQSTQH